MKTLSGACPERNTGVVIFWVSLLYFAEGLPFGVFMDLFPVWLRNEDVSLQNIGTLSLLGMAWTLKFLWAPLINYYQHHKRWVTAANIAMACSLLVLAVQQHVSWYSWIAMCIFVLASATNDTSIDGYSILLCKNSEFGRINSVRNAAYRVGLLFAGTLLIASGLIHWHAAYLMGAMIFLVNSLVVFRAPDIPPQQRPALSVKRELSAVFRQPGVVLGLALFIGALTWPVVPHIFPIHHAITKLTPIALIAGGVLCVTCFIHPSSSAIQGPVFGAFVDLMSRKNMLAVLAFILLYKVGEASLGFMVKPFWVDAGFSNQEIGMVSVNLGAVVTICGSILGGWYVDKHGIAKSLVYLGIINAFCNLVYAAAAYVAFPIDSAPTIQTRCLVYAASITESFVGGASSTGFLSFLIAITNRQMVTSEYAILTSVFAFSRSIAGWLSGYGTAYFGYALYFFLTFFFCFPCFLFFPAANNMLSRYYQEHA